MILHPQKNAYTRGGLTIPFWQLLDFWLNMRGVSGGGGGILDEINGMTYFFDASYPL